MLGHQTTTNNGAPRAYLNWLVFDRNYVFITGGFKQIATAAKEAGTDVVHEKLQMPAPITITQPGYVYIYLSNENSTPVEVFFDEFKVTHTKSPVIQSDDYYPFGLTFNSYKRENSVENKIKFQGQEHIDDLNLGWVSFKWRNHQPDIGRFFNVDPLSEKYVYNSTYAFSENHVTTHIELEGLEKVFFQDGLENSKGFKRAYQVERQTSTGKSFTKALEDKKTHNVFYFSMKYPADGATIEVKNKADYLNKLKNDGKLNSLGEKSLDKALEEGKPIILIGTHQSNIKNEDDKSTKTAAAIINHEEGTHANDILNGNKNDTRSDHLNYYGSNCDCPGNVSPDDLTVQTDPKYKNSQAKKGLDEIDKIIKAESKKSD